MLKNVSHRSSRPCAQKRQVPHGMMKAHDHAGALRAAPATPGPSLATVPEIS